MSRRRIANAASSRWTTPGVALVGTLTGGCSLTAIDNERCETNAQCRAAFGHASVCDDAGYCTEPQSHPRCSRTFPEDFFDRLDRYRDHIVLGGLYSYTDHLDTLLATELAVRQVNERAGLDGTPFAIVHCDYTPMAGDDLDDEQATEATSIYMTDVLGVSAIIGPRGSGRTEAAFNAVRDRDVVVISPSATSPALTALDETSPTDDRPGKLWRTAPPDSLQSEVIAADMRSRDVSRVAVMYQTGAYGEGLQDLFVERFMEQGGEAVELLPFSGGDFAATVAVVGEGLSLGDYQEVLFISSDIADYVTLFTAATATDTLEAAYTADGVGLFLTDAAFNGQLLDETVMRSAELFPKVRGTRPAPAEGVLFDAFAAAYAAQFDADPTTSAFTPHSYDAGWLVLYGVAWSLFNDGEIHGTGVARGLRRISDGLSVSIQPSSWPTVVDRFRNGDGVDIRGASGPLDYDPATEETTAPISLWAITPDPEAPSGYDFEELSRTEP